MHLLDRANLLSEFPELATPYRKRRFGFARLYIKPQTFSGCAAKSPPHRAEFLLNSAFHAEGGGKNTKNRYRKKFRPLP
jgi:hypothetical protein